MNTLRYKFSTVLIFTIFIGAQAQKLPNKQQVSLRAPAFIDGKVNEWNNTFQAYNSSTDLFYTISNDDNDLYLTIKAIHRSTINKIINGGTTFAIYTSGKKGSNEITITYPVFEPNGKPILDISKSFFEQSSTNIIVPDSIVALNDYRLDERSKLIMVTGIKGIDTLTSVYNKEKIKVAESFDNKMAYTYELSIALSYLSFPVKDKLKFDYHIVLNGSSIMPRKATDHLDKIQISDDNLIEQKLALEAQTTAPTDFWGEYTLAKK